MTEQNKGSVLVAYFSATGTTRRAAEKIASAAGGRTLEIRPARPYSSADLDWTDRASRVNCEHEDTGRRVELDPSSFPTLEGVGTVFIGYPLWWGEAPGCSTSSCAASTSGIGR